MAAPTLEPSAANVEESTVDGIELFVLAGEFDAATTPQLEQVLDGAIARGSHEIVLDMTGVTFVDMSTLSVIQHAIKLVYRHNGHLAVATMARAVLRAIELAGMRHSIHVHPTRDDAFKAVRGGERRASG
jgi:anti-sigma B factor antagonist